MELETTLLEIFLSKWLPWIVGVLIPTVLSIVAIVRQVKKEKAEVKKTEIETTKLVREVYSDVIDDVRNEMQKCREKVALFEGIEKRLEFQEKENAKLRKGLCILIKQLQRLNIEPEFTLEE